MQKRIIRYGVAGTGYFGTGLARIINAFKDAQVTAVLRRRNSTALAKELSCDVENTMEELAARKDVDAIIVATPNGLHVEPVVLAAMNKKHVFCEKPLALSVANCDLMINTCRQNRVIFMAGHILHFLNGLREVKRMIKASEIGRVLMCHSERTGWEEPQANVSWKKIKAVSGGHIFHHIHELDFIQSIIGPAKYVYCAGGNLAHFGEGFGDEDDMLLITLECQNNTFATMQYGTAFRKGEHFIKINGTKGYIFIDMCKVEITISSTDGVRKAPLHNKKDDEERTALNRTFDSGIVYGRETSVIPGWLFHEMQKEMQYFHSVVKGGEIDDEFAMLFDGSAARDSVATAEFAMKSLALKNRVEIG